MQPRSACVKTLCSSKERNRDRILNARQTPRNAVLIVVAGIVDPRWSPINPESGIPATAASFIGENAREQSRAAYEGRAR